MRSSRSFQRSLLVVLVGAALQIPAFAATARQPNILIIMADDLGYSDIGAFGGEISTPNLDQLAANGLQLTSMYAAPTCSPTRSMLMSGTDNHLAGLGTMAEALQPFHRGKPGYEGYLNQQVHSIAELLRDAGYRTNMAGKWHLGLEPEHGPDRRGFERSFVLLEGGAPHFKPSPVNPSPIEQVNYRENGEPVELPSDFYSTDFYTDKLISYLKHGERSGKPFFAYAAYTAPHWPLQAPDAYLDKYKGVYDAGYDHVRLARIERMKASGLLPADFKPAEPLPANPAIPRWEELDDEVRRVEARKMEIYAAMVDNLDHNIGRLLDYLRETGQYDNTLVVFLSDNGASGESHARYFPVGPDTDNRLENLGKRGSQIDYGARWSEVSSAPLHLYKGTTAEGGISVPAILQLPAGLRRQGIERSVARVDDLAPTFLALAGIPDPGDSYKGQSKLPITGDSMLPMLQGQARPAPELAGELFGNLYYREGEMKLLGLRAPAMPGEALKPLRLQLFNLSEDRAEQHDLSDSQPQTVERFMQRWRDYAREVGVVSPPIATD